MRKNDQLNNQGTEKVTNEIAIRSETNLAGGTYIHDDYGTVHYPIFHIIDWAYWHRNEELNGGAQVSSDSFSDDATPF